MGGRAAMFMKVVRQRPCTFWWSSSASAYTLKRTLITALYNQNQNQNQNLNQNHNAPLKSSSIGESPWFLRQRRGLKVLGSDVRSQKRDYTAEKSCSSCSSGRIFQVIKAQHTQHGRGGASIQVELRDVDTGNKVTERFRTDESIERVFVEEKSFQYLYSEADIVVLTDSDTFEQIEVTKDLFGKAAVYLKDDMTVRVQYYDGKPMSATVPTRVTCTVVEAQAPMKGLSVNPQYKKVLLDNGLTVLAPPFIVTGDAIVVNTADDTYMTRAK